MTAVTLTLTDFLSARIAEDEREARDYRDDLADNPPSAYDAAQVGWIDAGSPERVLAECEAKRHVIEFCLIAGERGMDADAWTVAKQILRHLAAVYADHPDYRREWKP